MRKSKIGFSALVAVLALVVAPALPAVAAPVVIEQPISHVTVAAPGAPTILGVPRYTVTGELDGFCDFNDSLGELCVSSAAVWTNGSIADFVFGDCNLNDNVFLSSGPGQGQVVGGNMKGAINWDTGYAAQFFTQPNCQGEFSFLPPGNVISNPSGALLPWRSFTWVWWGQAES